MPRISKSSSIREILEQNNELSPKEVVQELKSKGIKVTTQLVSGVKHQLRNGIGIKNKNGTPTQSIKLEYIMWAKDFTSKIGSVEKAKEVLGQFGKIVG